MVFNAFYQVLTFGITPAKLRQPYVVPGIEPSSAICKFCYMLPTVSYL